MISTLDEIAEKLFPFLFKIFIKNCYYYKKFCLYIIIIKHMYIYSYKMSMILLIYSSYKYVAAANV